MKKIWFCKIGKTSEDLLPIGADWPMRSAVKKAYKDLTGKDADFVFSGWSGELTEAELDFLEENNK